MTEQQRRIHNAYNRAYYAQHRDRILQNKRDNREARNAYMRKYRAARRGKDLPEMLKAALTRQAQEVSPQERPEAPASTEAPTS